MDMKRRIPFLGLFCVLLASSGFAQSGPLDHAEVLGRLAQGYGPSYVAHLVKTRGVSFSSSGYFIERVKLAGGDGILVERLFESEASDRAHSISDPEPSYGHLASCAELIHTGAMEEAEEECRASIDENLKSAWPLVATAKVLQIEYSRRDSAETNKRRQEERTELLERAAMLAPNIASIHQDLAVGSAPRDVMAELQKASSLDTESLGVSESGQLANQLAIGYFRGDGSGAEEATSSPEPISLDPELQRRILIEPDLASNHLLLGASYLLVHHFEEALSELQMAIRLEPDNPALHNMLAGYYRYRGMQEACLAELRESVRIVSAGIMPRMMVAGALEQFGRTPEAIEELRSLLSTNPAAVEPSEGLVEVYLEHKDRNSAIAELRRSLKASSSGFPKEAELVEARYQDEERLADLLKENGELEASAEQYLYLLRFCPDNAGLHNAYGNLLLEQKKMEDAIGEFRQAVDLNPDDTQSRVYLGTALAQKGELGEAREQFQEVIAKNPEDFRTHELIGFAYMELKDEPDAINEFKRALELQPNSAQSENNLAWIHATSEDPKLRNPAEALALAHHAIEDFPLPNADYLDTLAEALLLNGQASEALTIEKQASELDPQNSEIQKRLEHFREAAQQLASRKP
jgi:tetratricopeptide (TPR) repeat protein